MQTTSTALLAAAIAAALGACTGTGTLRTTTYTEDPYYKPEPAVPVVPIYTDAEIAHSVDQALATIPGLDVNDVEVHVHEGVVHVQGHVHSYESKAQLEQLISSLDGVRHVDAADLVVAVPDEPYRQHYDPYGY